MRYEEFHNVLIFNKYIRSHQINMIAMEEHAACTRVNFRRKT